MSGVLDTGEGGSSVKFPSASCPCFNLRSWLLGCFALLYGLVLSSIPNDQFKDFTNYLAYAENGLPQFQRRLNDGILNLVTNEPLWLLVNAGMSRVLEPDAVVRSIIFFSASSVAWHCLSHLSRKYLWLLMFLLLPAVMKNHLIHIRQGLAIAIFLWGWFSPRDSMRWILIGLSPLIHASFFFFLPLIWISKTISYLKLSVLIHYLIFIAFGIVASLSLGVVATYLGARQGLEYKFALPDVSGLAFVMWFLIFVLFLSSGRKFLQQHLFEIGLLILYISAYWLVEVAARVFESGLLLILFSGFSLPPRKRKFFLLTIAITGFYMWLIRINSPALGFGIGI